MGLPMKLVEDFLRPFTTKQVGEILTTAMEMENYGLTASDVVALCRQHLEKLVEDGGKTAGAAKSAPERHQCPECSSVLDILPVNISKCTAVGGEWRSVMVCANHDCRYTRLSVESAAALRSAGKRSGR